jgi:CSLREA domain-containing protein
MSANGSLNSSRCSTRFRIFSIFLANCVWLAPLCLAPATAALASDTYTVTVNTDDYSGTPTTLTGTASHCPANGTGSSCTLRDAITAALADPGSTIKFSVKGTNTLNFVLPIITTSTNIVGPGANALTISGGYQQFYVSGTAATTVTISGLTLANANNTVVATGLMPSYGGAIYNVGATLTVDHMVFANNTTGQPSLAGEGAAILNNSGSLTVNDCFFIGNYSQNTTTDNGLGGAITNIGTLNIKGSTFAGNIANDGSAVYSLSGLSITDSLFTGNYAAFSGAVTFTSGTLTVKNSTFVANTAVFGPNDGTSIYNDGNPALSPPTTMVVTNSILDVPTTGAACVTTATPSDCPVNGQNGNVVATLANLKLASLGYYGGPTPTMPPLPGSAAHCVSSSSNFPGADQRGFGVDISCGAGLADAGSVQANYLTVNTAADDAGATITTCGATCTLRDAINTALADGNGDIDFASGLSGTIALGGSLPSISTTGSVDIMGPGANLLSVSGAGTYPILNIAGGTVDISGLTITGGKTTASGGGIDNTGGMLTLSNSILSSNSATGNGGAINNGGSMLVSDSTFATNKAGSGSAIYNTGALTMTYSTVAGNTATASGGIYNASGAILTAVNSTFAGNTGTGSGIFNSGALAVTNSILDATTECSGTGCPATGKGNVVGATKLAVLGSYGGPTQTVLPQPGSSAICGGSAAYIPLFVTTDQRGFANENTTYTGYSATAPCVDAGAVQTNYTSAQFVGAPYVGNANTPGTAPPVIVSVMENGQNIGGVPVTLSFSGTGTATGLTSSTVGGTGATFTLQVNQASAPTDSLSVSIPVVGANTLTAGPAQLTVNPQGAATSTTPAAASATTLSTSVNLSATVTSGGKPATAGQVTFTVQYSSGAVVTAVGTVNSSGVATVSYPLPQGLAANTYTVSVTYSDIGGSFGPSTATGNLAVVKVTPTVSTWPTASAITVGQTLASSTLTGGVASVPGSFAFTTSTTAPPSGTSSQSVTFTPTVSADYTTVVGSVSVTANAPPTPIVPYIEVNGGAWQTTGSATVQYSDSVNLGPQPLTGGSWSWTGPNGYSSTARQINSIPLTLPTNVFVATYTNPAGAKSTQTFTITVAPTAITPYLEVNGGAWQTTASATVQLTDLVNLGPQPLTGGSWSWTGPGGFTSTSRQINSIPLTLATNVFVATYTNPAGVKSTQTFTISIAPSTIVPYIQVGNGAWTSGNSTIVFLGSSVNLGPQPLTGGSWSWTGPNGYTSTSRQINNIPLGFGYDVYVVTYTNAVGIKSTATFTIIVL